ncbi:Unknown protein, partial [Striga hermonthica]
TVATRTSKRINKTLRLLHYHLFNSIFIHKNRIRRGKKLVVVKFFGFQLLSDFKSDFGSVKFIFFSILLVGIKTKQRAGGQARVYTITHDEAANHAGTMSGMLSISNLPVFALCDTDAIHSFISSRCLEALSVVNLSKVDPLEVSLASGKIIISDSIVRNLPINIGGRILEGDVYVIEMRDFDVILGMDWLTRYRADIR